MKMPGVAATEGMEYTHSRSHEPNLMEPSVDPRQLQVLGTYISSSNTNSAVRAELAPSPSRH